MFLMVLVISVIYCYIVEIDDWSLLIIMGTYAFSFRNLCYYFWA